VFGTKFRVFLGSSLGVSGIPRAGTGVLLCQKQNSQFQAEGCSMLNLREFEVPPLEHESSIEVAFQNGLRLIVDFRRKS
jgi:hypothetical protein